MRFQSRLLFVLVLSILSPGFVSGQVEVSSVPFGDQQIIETFDAPVSTSRTTGGPVVSIPLDDTGIGDWRFLNPRKPQKVPQASLIEFENRTDRTFKVTTRLKLDPTTQIQQNAAQQPVFLNPGSPPSAPPIPLEDCAPAPGDPTRQICTAGIVIEPYGSDLFPHDVLLFQADTGSAASFNIKFFEEEETPARSALYLVSNTLATNTLPPSRLLKKSCASG